MEVLQIQRGDESCCLVLVSGLSSSPVLPRVRALLDYVWPTVPPFCGRPRSYRLAARGETPARPRAHGEFAARLVGDTTKRASFRCLRGSRGETPRCSHGQHVRRLLRRLTATRSRCRMNALGRSIHVRGKGCAYDHDRFAHRDPSSSFSLVRTQARERGSACPARPIRTPPSGSI